MHYRSLLSHGCHLRSGIGIGSNEHAKASSRGINSRRNGWQDHEQLWMIGSSRPRGDDRAMLSPAG
jgi:hypothetical protein